MENPYVVYIEEKEKSMHRREPWNGPLKSDLSASDLKMKFTENDDARKRFILIDFFIFA